MIQYLRKIRRTLLAEGKFNKYLIYAVGEIVLVVIGILIALGINNWNEQRKNASLERAFLENFRGDLEADIQTLNEKINENLERINNTDSILSVLSQKQQLSQRKRVAFCHWNLSLAFEAYFIPEKSTINQFEANNNGQLISSKVLKDKLFRYYSINERIEANVERSIQLYQHNFLTREIIQSILGGDITEILVGSDFDRPDFELKALRQNSEYIFALITKKIATTNQNEVYQRVAESAEELIAMIDLEIND